MSSTDTLIPERPDLPAAFRAIASTVVPECVHLDERGWADLESLVRDSLRQRPPAIQRKVKLFVNIVEWLPMLRHRKRFTDLDQGSRTAFLTALQEHRIDVIRVGFWGLRTLVFLGYYGRADATKAIDYTPDPGGWASVR
jgi:hypothetical protein